MLVIYKKEKSYKELFQCEYARQKEFELVNYLRKIHHVSPL